MSNALGTQLNDMGLDALLADIQTPTKQNELSLEQIKACPNQPRTLFDSKQLESLTESIKQYGVLQPIVVMPTESGYQIIAGERRWLAAIAAGLTHIPAIIRESSEQERATLALVENMQRSDLSAIEKAHALQKLLTEHNLNQQTLATHLGLSRSSLSNLVRLLELDPIIQGWIQDQSLSMGHARALLAAEASERLELAHKVIEQQLSVRATEALTQKKKSSHKVKPSVNNKILSDYLARSVSIHAGKKKGKLVIEYTDQTNLYELLSQLGLPTAQVQQALDEISST